MSPVKASLELLLRNLHVLEICKFFIFLDSSLISHRNRFWEQKNVGYPQHCGGECPGSFKEGQFCGLAGVCWTSNRTGCLGPTCLCDLDHEASGGNLGLCVD